jgi:hydrogenase expression/formation protein HypE
MKIGKLSNDDLHRLISGNTGAFREEIMIRPGIGEDCAVIEFGDYGCVLSTDPITGATNEIGKLAVHVSCNDVVSSGGVPLAIMITILAPEKATLEDLESIMKQASKECEKLNVEIIGGHTEITEAVNKIVVSVTAIGKNFKEKIVKTAGVKSGDAVFMTKKIALEGTGIIAYEKENELSHILSYDEIKEAKSYLDKISVVKEGLISTKFGVNSMHDVTEGGIFGALFEVCSSCGKGCEIDYLKLPISDVTKKISMHYGIDPLKLISSGSMLITVSYNKKDEFLRTLESEGIEIHEIGVIKEDKNVKIIMDDGSFQIVNSAEADELYKVI